MCIFYCKVKVDHQLIYDYRHILHMHVSCISSCFDIQYVIPENINVFKLQQLKAR